MKINFIQNSLKIFIFSLVLYYCKSTPSQITKDIQSRKISEIKIIPYPESNQFYWNVHIVWKEFQNPIQLKIKNKITNEVVFSNLIQEPKVSYQGIQTNQIPPEFHNLNEPHTIEWEIELSNYNYQEKFTIVSEYSPEFKRNLYYLLKFP